MTNTQGVIYADGTGPNAPGSGGDGGCGKPSELVPSYGYPPNGIIPGGFGPNFFFNQQGGGSSYNAPDGHVHLQRGEVNIKYLHGDVGIPIDNFMKMEPVQQNTLMGWATRPNGRYYLPSPPKPEECANPGCRKDPQAPPGLRKVKASDWEEKMMCFMCCAGTAGYGKAMELWK